ncbi:MAG: transporter [Flavobacterium sp.]|nr:transporter [Flavobacterium sp.]
MKSKILSIILFSIPCLSQNKPLEADRPDQTETPAIVPKGMFQVENGFTFRKNDVKRSTFSLPSTLWKYGVNENFEMRLIIEFVLEKNELEKSTGFLPIFIGFKVKLTNEKGIVPKTSFIAHIGLPKVASSNYKIDYLAPEFRFTMQHSLTEKLSLGYNLGAEWAGFSAEPTFIYTLTTGYSLTEKLGSYIELFGFLPQNSTANHNFDGGFTYLINNNFMVDLSSSIGITNNAPKHYFALGISFRI